MSAKLANGVVLQIPPGTGVAFDPDAFDTAIRSQGVPFIHWRAMECPVGLIDQYDERRPHDDHSGCSNGHIYTEAGTITCLFMGSGSKTDSQDIGYLDGSTVKITAPRMYDGTNTPVQLANFDRLYLPDEITVPAHQLVETSATGKDRLNFPVVEVMDIVDARGKRYGAGDYTVENGQIKWLNGSGPGFDLQLGKGLVYSIRYTYRPYYYVNRILHQIRIAQVETQLERKVMRFPQEAILQREYVAEKEAKDPQAPDPNSPRQHKGPREGIFGPR